MRYKKKISATVLKLIRLMLKIFLVAFIRDCFVALFLAMTFLLVVTPVHAIYDPLSVPNNKVGIHIIQATPDEYKPAQELVNTNGDWGYITLLIESNDRNEGKWQEVFNDLRKRHLIPLIRLASKPHASGYWEKPYPNEEQAWADFLDKLNWPTKNRYVIVYNEPNHATEWGNSVEARGYAQVLNKTIDALREKSEDFFIMNAGFDASAPEKLPAYQDQYSYMKSMNEEVPGIFQKLDGWSSHSYPNPGFVGSPDATGRGTVRTWIWERDVLKELGVTENLPIFITETGWKQSEGMHSGGVHIERSLPSVETVAQYYKQAFDGAWNHPQIVAITPFVLGYFDPPFDHFSFKKVRTNDGLTEDNFHPQFKLIKDLPKTSGKPIQTETAQLIKGEIFASIVKDETYEISLTFKNTGQSIWNDSETVSLKFLEGGSELGIQDVSISEGIKVEPNQEHTFKINLKAPQSGVYSVRLNLFRGNTEFENEDFRYATEVKAPVILIIKSNLRWKDDSGGNYFLTIVGAIGSKLSQVVLGATGQSEEFEVKYLLPDYTFNFTLEKPFYKSKTIRRKVTSGVNELDFGTLQPDIGSAILMPTQLWKILPFSN